MIGKICLIISCLFPLASHALEGQYMENLNRVDLRDNSETLLKACHRYLDFINQISRGEIFPQLEQAETLLSLDCKKILNGQLLTENREDFVSDLLSVYQNQGGWKISPVDIIIAPPSNTVVLRLFIEMENFGAYTAIVILRYNSSFLITEINEVLNQVQIPEILRIKNETTSIGEKRT